MIQIKTPRGMASKLFLVQPDTKFFPEGMYKVSVTLTASESADLLRTCMEEATSAFGPKGAAKAKMPFSENGDGTVTFTFKSMTKPDLYDSKAGLLGPETVKALRIGSGSTIRVNGRTEAYEGFGGGVALVLEAVQILHLVESHGFEPDLDGSFVVQDNREQCR